MIRERIREWLGLDQLLWNIQDMRENDLVRHKQLNRIEAQLSTITPGLGRVIAKLDARFAEDESNASPERKAESDKIGAEVIKRLEAEALARAPYNHDLGDK